MKRFHGDLVWRLIGIAGALLTAVYALQGDWLGMLAPFAMAMLFFAIPKLLDSQHAMGWTAAANRADDLLAGTAIYDGEQQALVPLVPDLLRMQLYVDLMESRPPRRQYEQRMQAMMRDLAHMKDPTREQIAEVYRRYHR